MALSEVSVDLMHRGFPFNVDNFGSTVIINQGFELNRTPFVNRGEDFSDNSGLPQCYYMHNVMPHVRGYSSLHYLQALPPHPYGTDVRVDDVHVLRDTQGNSALYSPAFAENLVYNANAGGWNRFPLAGYEESRVTVQHLKGVTYICYAGLGLYTYNFQTNSLDPVTVTGGIDFNTILGVVAGRNYLVLYGRNAVYWSSGTDATDFTASTVSGAGASSVLAVRSEITTILPIADGFIVYTTVNAIGASYSGVPGSPWIFREIPGSSGVGLPQHVSYESSQEVHVAWTSSGFQQVSFRRAEPFWPELSDTIGRGVFTDYDFNKHEPCSRHVNKLEIKVSSVGERFTLVSVRDESKEAQYLISYLWDWGTNRWGRLRYPHQDLFDFRPSEFAALLTYEDKMDPADTYDAEETAGTSYLSTLGSAVDSATSYGDNFGIMQRDGSVWKAVAHPDIESLNAVDTTAYKPVIVFGRFQLRRHREVILHETQANSDVDTQVTVYTHDLSAQVTHKDVLDDLYPSAVVNRYFSRIFAQAVSLEFCGRFNLTNLDLVFSEGGRRHTRGSR